MFKKLSKSYRLRIGFAKPHQDIVRAFKEIAHHLDLPGAFEDIRPEGTRRT